MARKPQQTAELSKSDKALIRSLEKVIDEALKRGTAYTRPTRTDLDEVYGIELPESAYVIKLPKRALSLNERSKAALISRYTGAGWKRAELEYSGAVNSAVIDNRTDSVNPVYMILYQ